VILTSTGTGLRRLGIRVPYYGSPRASYPCHSSHLVILIMSFSFRIAIWDRKVFPSRIVVGIWLVGLTLNIYCTFCVSQLCAPCSHLSCLHLQRLDNGATFCAIPAFRVLDSRTLYQKMKVSYDAALGTCTISSLHKLLVNSVGVLVVDVVLFMSMLIGLLRFTHRSSTGIWHLLYQQVIILYIFSCARC
jgi:hypothetical protein